MRTDGRLMFVLFWLAVLMLGLALFFMSGG